LQGWRCADCVRRTQQETTAAREFGGRFKQRRHFLNLTV
jgi:hypothetical protein